MTIEPSIRAELAAALRTVNAAYSRLPEDRRPDVSGRDDLDQAVDEACLSGDRHRALTAIAEWKRHWLGECERSMGQKPAASIERSSDTAAEAAGEQVA